MLKFVGTSITIAFFLTVAGAGNAGAATPSPFATAASLQRAPVDGAAIERAFEASTATLKPITYGPGKLVKLRTGIPPKVQSGPNVGICSEQGYGNTGVSNAMAQAGPPSVYTNFYQEPWMDDEGGNVAVALGRDAQTNFIGGINLGGRINGGDCIVPTVKVRTETCSVETSVPVKAVFQDGSGLFVDLTHVQYAQSGNEHLIVEVTTPSGHSETHIEYFPQVGTAKILAPVGVTGFVSSQSPLYPLWTHTQTPSGLARVFIGKTVQGRDHFAALPPLNGFQTTYIGAGQSPPPGLTQQLTTTAGITVTGADLDWIVDGQTTFSMTYTVEYDGQGALGYRFLASQPKLGGLCEN